MIYISFVELIPSLFLDEDEEEEETKDDHQQVHRLSQDTEPEGTLKVDTEGNQHSVCSERSMHPAEAIGKADDDPGDEAEERAVEYPLCEFFPIAHVEQGTVDQHYKRTNWRDDANY